MRSARSVLAACILLLAIPSFGKQPPQNTSTPQPASDPQAVAVVQAAITALGGATAIGQSQTWDFQGQLDGPMESGNKDETIKFQLVNSMIVVNGVSRRAPRIASPSLFLPVLVGPLLLQESQDSNYVMHFDGPSTLASNPVTVIRLISTDSRSLAQIWAFDAATGLPDRVYFELPAQIGQSESFRATVDLSNWRTVSGVQYPFTVLTYMEGIPRQTLSLQSITPGAAASPSQTAQVTGGVE
jgi:hypothetical protein